MRRSTSAIFSPTARIKAAVCLSAVLMLSGHVGAQEAGMDHYRNAQRERAGMIKKLQARATEARMISPAEMAQSSDDPIEIEADRQDLLQRQRELAEEIQKVARQHYEKQQRAAMAFQKEIQGATSAAEQQAIRERYRTEQREAARQMQEDIFDLREQHLNDSIQDADTAYQRQRLRQERERMQAQYEETEQRLRRAEDIQAVSQQHVLEQQEARQDFESQMQNADTQEERLAIQQRFRAEQLKAAQELQRQIQELRDGP